MQIFPPAQEIKKLLQQKKEILSKIPKNISTFILTVSTNPSHIINLCKRINPSHVQIIENLNTKDILFIKQHLPKIKIVKVIAVQDESALLQAKKYEQVVDFILLDSKVNSQKGGTGRVHDWKISSKIVKESYKPVFLAGGLSPENIREAISKVKSYGVDADTKLEKNPGKKDYKKLKEFMLLKK